MARANLDKPYLLRGYVRRLPNGKWMGVCLTLNLVVEAATREATKAKLESLIEAYLDDAVENDEVDAYIPRHAPLAFYVEYWRLKLASWFGPRREPSTIFSELRPIRQHA